jgi:large conductance mechanosensitive channel
MPIIGIIIGGIDFTGLSITIGGAVVNYGTFIQNVIDFLIVAICIFFLVKVVERINRKAKKDEETEEKKDEQVILLGQIRDLLEKQQNSNKE